MIARWKIMLKCFLKLNFNGLLILLTPGWIFLHLLFLLLVRKTQMLQKLEEYIFHQLM